MDMHVRRLFKGWPAPILSQNLYMGLRYRAAVRIVQLLPKRALNEQNANQETKALMDAGHEVLSVIAPRPGVGGMVWLRTIGALKAIHLKPDIVSARDLDTLAAGLKVKQRTGAKLVYDMHDVYSYMVEGDVPKRLLPVIEKHERKLLPKVDLVLASDEGRAKWISDQWTKVGTGIDPAWDLQIILNCRDPVVPYVPLPKTTSLSYTGTLHPSRFIREMVEAMSDLDDVALYVAGPRTPGSLYNWLEKTVCSPSCTRHNAEYHNIVFFGHLSPEQALYMMQLTTVSVQMADPKFTINRLGPYNRLFDAMAVGRPVIATVGTANGDIASALGMGVISVYDVDAYKTAVKTLFEQSYEELERMSRNAYAACVGGLNWKEQAKKLVKAYADLG